jgi:LEA14-like dessication related protein
VVVLLVVVAGAAVVFGLFGTPSVTGVENRFGGVNETATVVESNLTVSNPNPFGASAGGLTADYVVAMNDIRMAQGTKTGLSIPAGRSELPFTTFLANERIPAWWVSHIRDADRRRWPPRRPRRSRRRPVSDGRNRHPSAVGNDRVPMSTLRPTRRAVVLAIRGLSVVLLFAAVLEGPDLLLLAVLDARYWAPIGLLTGLLSLPLLRLTGAGFAPPWTLPACAVDASPARAGLYHLLCTLVGAWLWTYPTLAVVAWVHRARGHDPIAVGTVPPDSVSVALGVVLAGLLFLLPLLVAFVRVTTFRTTVDFRTTSPAALLRPALAGVGGTVAVGVVVSFLAATL